MNTELLKQLCDIVGVSGREEKISNFLFSYLKSCGYHAEKDAIGNVYVFLSGKKRSKKLLLTAHIDEVGFMVANHLGNGIISAKAIGAGLPDGKHLVVSENGIVGLIKSYGETKFLEIDVGIQAESKVSKGEMFTYKNEIIFQNGRIIGSALDNRACVSAILESLPQIDKDTTIAFTVREEISCRGIICAVEKVNPDAVICIDTSVADIDGGKDYLTNMILGGGVGIKCADSCTVIGSTEFGELENVAKEKNIKYQVEIGQSGTTELFALERQKVGIAFSAISLPVSNIHSGNSMISIKDYENLCKFIVNI